MFELITQLKFFKFDKIVRDSKLLITWFIIEKDSNDIRCFTLEEIKEFTNFITSNPENFPEGKNYHNCNEEEILDIELNKFLLVENSVSYPSFFILRQHPKISNNIIRECSDIILTDISGKNKHNYNLSFDVVGKIG